MLAAKQRSNRGCVKKNIWNEIYPSVTKYIGRTSARRRVDDSWHQAPHAALYGDLKEANPPRLVGRQRESSTILNFTFSGPLGPVFGLLLQHIRGASRMEKRHYQTAFAPLLLGIAAAIVLSLFSKRPAQPLMSLPHRAHRRCE